MRTVDNTLERLDDGLRSARKVIRDSTRKADDLVHDASRGIRRRPLGSVGTAFLAGAALGTVVTLLVARSNDD